MKKKEIRKHFYKYVVKNNGTPEKLKHFLKFAGITKEAFSKKYKSLKEVEIDILKTSLKDVLAHLIVSAEYQSYSHRNKGLSFMFSWLEFMDKNKKYFRKCQYFSSYQFMNGTDGFKSVLKTFAKNLIKEGINNKEFKDRGIPPRYMSDFFCNLFVMVLKQWQLNDCKKNSKEEYIDALIEKSMLFFFDSLAPNLFDTFLDLMKHKRSKK